ncbi:Rossmann-like and DUF2520 domain-containing protein [Planktosalinus lacus]|uniref:DUF2520 domain-containing protein n=1 Tax=Planktosalinus lacus TaxID=1526573 RepID=A0A8J2V6V1_9FLAO|nr:Rossmann-like and DUF2520 domain-containing protein [Planktosalinus lacus]GGD83936.1 hypothetical protein GCM10011312_04970 [Planktosalinus lacus]
MIRIVILGTGNVATHLLKAFVASPKTEVIQLYNRNQKGLDETDFKGHKTTATEELLEADCYLIAIPDDAIAELSSLLPFKNRLVLHTSGSVAITDMDSKNRRGVFYPLQTFSKNRNLDFSEIPICVETENAQDLTLVKKLGNAISNQQFEINSDKRKQLHLAAVFVCNFVNHLYQVGFEITSKNELPFSILIPLIQETAQKIKEASPAEMQTGPAKRNDQKTMEKHLLLLNEEPLQKQLYKLISEAIQQTYGRKEL